MTNQPLVLSAKTESNVALESTGGAEKTGFEVSGAIFFIAAPGSAEITALEKSKETIVGRMTAMKNLEIIQPLDVFSRHVSRYSLKPICEKDNKMHLTVKSIVIFLGVRADEGLRCMRLFARAKR